jgi:hypothetical protein
MGRELITLAVLALGCRDKAKPPPAPEKPAGPAVLAEKSFYRIEPGPRTPCAPGAPCEARLAFSALGEYHVNDRYPFKFVADETAGLIVDGTGTFTQDDAKHGMMTIKFRALKRGTARLSGTFKLSVCTDEKCEIEEPKLAFEVPIN